MKERIRKVLAIIAAFCIFFTGLPVMSGGFAAHAATPYWKNFKTTCGDGGVWISWKQLSNSQRKKITGIAVYRNGKRIARVKKNKTLYLDGKVKAGKKYTYQLKTYKKTTKTVKMYYNKKTKKWQLKKISRAKTKKARKTTYKYANASAKKKITVKVKSSGTKEETKPETGEKDSWTATDYLGEKWTITKKYDSYDKIYFWSCNDSVVPIDDNLARYDRTRDGEFTVRTGYGDVTWVQKGGVTFNKTAWEEDGWFVAYNADPAKMSRTATFPDTVEIREVQTYGYEKRPRTTVRVYDNGIPVARNYSLETFNEKVLNDYADNTVSMKGDLCGQTGWGNTIYHVACLYDNNIIFEEERTLDGLNAALGGNVNLTKEALAISHAAITANGGKKNYDEDMRAIERYVRKNYTYDQYNCDGGVYILHTYSVLEYGIEGFIGPGSAKPGDSNYGWHEALHMDTDPDKYYETNGHHGDDCNCRECVNSRK